MVDVAFATPTITGKLSALDREKEIRVSDFPCIHTVLLMISALFTAIALPSFIRRELQPMAFLSAYLPDPGCTDSVSFLALLAANIDRSLTAAAAITFKQPEQHAHCENRYSAAHILFSQSVSNDGRPLRLTAREIEIHKDTRDVIEKLMLPVVTSASGPLLIPIATVDDDNAQLSFDRPGVDLCCRGKDCIAHMIEGPPAKPLGAYRGVGHDPAASECLLCLRHQVAMIVQMHRSHGSTPPVGILPSFCNVVDAPGGYRSSFCAVTPDDVEIVSGAVHIMGSPVSFKKVYNPYTKLWYVDQSAAVFGSAGFFF